MKFIRYVWNWLWWGSADNPFDSIYSGGILYLPNDLPIEHVCDCCGRPCGKQSHCEGCGAPKPVRPVPKMTGSIRF